MSARLPLPWTLPRAARSHPLVLIWDLLTVERPPDIPSHIGSRLADGQAETSLRSPFGVASTTRPPARDLTALAMAIGLNPLCSTFGLEKLHKILRNNRPSEGLAELQASARSKRSSAWSCGRSRCGSSPVPDALDRFLSRRRPPHQGSSLVILAPSAL